MLCGSRSGEALGARWSEIDDDAPIWEIPVTRMKNGKSHVVPLTDPALGILKIMRECHPSSDYLFPADHGGLLSNRALESLIPATESAMFGARVPLVAARPAGQRDRHAARDVRGNFVAHRLRVEGAYGRSSSTAKKRAALELWAAYLAKERFVVDLIGV